MEKIIAQHPLSQSEDIIKQNLETIKTLFPTIVKEGKIDVEELKALLGEEIETDEEYYRFTWAGKSQARQEANKPSTGTLRPAKEESKDWDTTGNLFIEGDNLEVLKLMQKSYANKIKMIYIDPPYNTGKDFVYKDKYADNLGNYLSITGQTDEEGKKLSTNAESDGRYHSNWLNMMYPRLKLARNLLKDDGTVFISIDDREVNNLRKICDEVFGEENFIGNLIIQTATDNNPTQINTEHEYMVCYSKSKKEQPKWFGKNEGAKKIIEKYGNLKEKFGNDLSLIQVELRKWIKNNESILPRVAHYDNIDEKGVFHDGDIANTIFGGYKYEIYHPETKKVCKIPDKGFRFPETTLRKMIKDNEIVFGKDESTLIKPKKRIEDAKDVLRTIIYEDGRTSTKVVESLIGRSVFENPKSHFILARIMGFVCTENDIVLDFFAGSGSTAHAVFKINSEDKINCKFICIQLPEPTSSDSEAFKAGYKTIAEITKERIRRAGEKVKSEMEEERDLDIGFRVFKLDSSNIKAWDGDVTKFEENLLSSVENIKDDRTEEDVLYEILLKSGLDLTVPIEEKMIAGKKVFNIGMGALFICLANKIKTEVAEGIGKWKEKINPATCRVIFKDTGFTDVEKTNSIQILKRFGITEVNTI